MPSYDPTRFDPPAPVALVTLRDGNKGANWENVPMLIDTGSDISLVPASVIERLALEAEPNIRFEVEGFDGSRSLAQMVQLELVFLGRTFRGQFLLVEQEWGIIGRNILNAVSIMLDGPAGTWKEIRRK